jgi:GNAT superfamily N-acetyltransferase
MGQVKKMRTLQIDGAQLVVRPARWDEIIDLRHAVLRQGLPREEAVFAGDDAPTSRHWAAFSDGDAVGCATLHASQWEGEPAWQLRGMATSPEFRRKGLGKIILEEMERELLRPGQGGLEGPGPLLWCNARVPYVPFYEAMGWRVVSGQFEIPTAGPHVKMVKRLAR